ncbi:MAG TPA: hypothetical protein VGN29_21685 [Solirubrobacteraceae bacterium]|nr:hypothetical protein [Solirubrobacteraceae bacterium]
MLRFSTGGEPKPLLCIKLFPGSSDRHPPREVSIIFAQQRVDEPANVSFLQSRPSRRPFNPPSIDMLCGFPQRGVSRRGRHALVVVTTQAQDLERLLKAGVGFAGGVVEPADLPTIGLRDSSRRPFQHQVIPAELCHRLGDVEELERVGQIATVKPNDHLDVPVKDRQPLTHIANCVGVGVVNLVDRQAIRHHSRVAQRGCISHRIDLEEILVTETKPDHPGCQLVRLGDSRVTGARMEIQEVSHQIADQTRGVVGMEHDLHDVRHRALQQLDELAGRLGPYRFLELSNDRASRLRPFHARPIIEKPTCSKRAIDLPTESPKVAISPGRCQPHSSGDVVVSLGRIKNELNQLLSRERIHHLVKRLLSLTTRPLSRHPHRPSPPRHAPDPK